jgi:hypothetical protein
MSARILCGALCVLGLLPAISLAQYDTPREYGPLSDRFVALGAISHEFLPRPENTTPDSLLIEFQRWAPVLSYHQGPVEVMFAYTWYQLRGVSCAAIHLGTLVSTDVPLIGTRASALALPVCLAADYTKAGSDGAEKDNFNVGSIGIGAGLLYRHAGSELDFSLRGLGIIHYAFEGYGSNNGSSLVITGDARLLWRSSGLFDGVVFGYRFRSQAWSIATDRFDYRATLHGPYVGVMF